MAPITPNLAAPDGSVSIDLIKFYETRARGGVGLIITGWSFVGGESSRDIGLQIGINDNRLMPSLNRLTEAIHKWGAKIFIQLSYTGRKTQEINTCGNSKAKGLGDLLGSGYEVYRPQEIALEDINNIARLYGEAALRAQNAGFDGVEIAGTQEEIIFLFLLKKYNKRNDVYNGRLEARSLFLTQIIEQIKYYCGNDYPVGFRFVGFEDPHYFNNKIVDPHEVIKIAQILEKKGVSFLDVFRSVLPVYVTKREYTTSRVIKDVVHIPVIAAGAIVDPDQAEQIIVNGYADFIAMGRELIADPHWVNKVRDDRCDGIVKCIRCNECLSRGSRLLTLGCTVNMDPVEGEKQAALQIQKTKKGIAVIGGGPSGVRAAIAASRKGYDVTLFEKGKTIGGNLIPASEPKFKFEFKNLLHQLHKELSDSSVNVILNHEIRSLDSLRGKFDAIILATGSIPKKLNVPIADYHKVHYFDDVICYPERIEGQNVVMIGGGAIGVETALFLHELGKNIEIIEIESDILLNEPEYLKKCELKSMLKNAAIKIYTSSRVMQIKKSEIEISKDNNIHNIPFDSIVIAIGSNPNNRLLDEENPTGRVFQVGDCRSVCNLYNAVHEGYLVGSNI